MALSSSHDLLVSADWKGANLFELLLAQLKPFGNEERISISGPPLVLTPIAVQYLGIAFHELATNSAKYGVLSGAKGHIAVAWAVSESHKARLFRLTWAEALRHKGTRPTRANRRADTCRAAAMSGVGHLTHDADGLVWALEAPRKLCFIQYTSHVFDDARGEGPHAASRAHQLSQNEAQGIAAGSKAGCFPRELAPNLLVIAM
ncbi:sensor histidine kinase [Mesorhizobium australicum]